MNDKIVPSLKLVYKPLIMYYGEWELLSGLEELSVEKRGKKQYDEFLNRYFYMPLSVIFKDEEVKLFITQVNKPRKLISKGKLILTPTKLIFEEKEFVLKDLIIASAIGGQKFNFAI